jgi:hypothetical protein
MSLALDIDSSVMKKRIKVISIKRSRQYSRRTGQISWTAPIGFEESRDKSAV